jgi:hypothetical protein
LRLSREEEEEEGENQQSNSNLNDSNPFKKSVITPPSPAVTVESKFFKAIFKNIH